MAIDFPSSPANGQISNGYTYDSTSAVWGTTNRASFTGLRDVNASGPPVGASVRYSGSQWEMFEDLTLKDRLVLLPANSPYSFDINNYPYARALYVRAQGGGGGGGFAGATNVTTGTAVGGAGGGGQYTEAFIPVDNVQFRAMYYTPYSGDFPMQNFPKFPFDIVIGAGGAGGTVGAGASGGDSVFFDLDLYTGADRINTGSKSALCGAEGGDGGATGATPAATNRIIAGAAGGNDPVAGAPSDINVYTFTVLGGRGEDVWTLGATTASAVMSGMGGKSFCAPAQVGVSTSSAGNAGTGYGGGGTGGANVTGQTVGRNGGAGSGGFVIVEIYG